MPGQPRVVGAAKVGSTLTAQSGTWRPATTFSDQWQRDGKQIAGATATTYRLTAQDRGKAISVTVTAKLSGYANVARTSKATAVVKMTSRSLVDTAQQG